MRTVFSTAMRQATQLTREQNVIEATRLVQRVLSGQGHALLPDEQSPESSRSIELQANVAESLGRFEQPRQNARIASAGVRDAEAKRRPAARMRRPLGEVLKLLRQADPPSFGRDAAPFIRRTPKGSLPKLAPASPTPHRRHDMTAPREAARTFAP